MSTKTIYKRIALVAVASLGAGLLSVAPASAVTETVTATMTSPVRVSFTDTVRDAVPVATFTVNSTAVLVDATTDAQLTVTQAPLAGGTLSVLCGGATAVVDSLDSTGAKGSDGAILGADTVSGTAFTCTVAITTAPATGTYRATLVLEDTDATADVVTVNFSFTTTGAPTSIELTTAAASSAPSASIATTVTLRDAANNVTQPATVDSIALTATAGVSGNNAGSFATPTGSAAGVFIATGTSAADTIHDGTGTLAYTNSSVAGASTTLTATPRGTLGALAAKTLTVTAVAANTGVPTATVTTSNTIVRSASSTAVLNKYTVSTNQATVTFNVAGLTPNTSVTYTVGSSTTTTVAVNGGSAANINSAASFTSVSSATGTLAVTAQATTPAAQTITLDLNGGTGDVTGQVNADFTYAAPQYVVTVTTPAATPLFRTSSAITYTGRVADQFGNVLAGASVLATGTPTPATTPSTITATAVTAADGTYTVTLPAVAATTTSLSTVVSATSAASINPAAANVAYFTTTGIAATLVLTDGDTDALTLTTDDKSSRTIPLGLGGGANVTIADMSDAGVANADNWVSITPQTTVPASVGYSVTATNGIRLFANGTTMTTTLGLANTAAITGTGGQAFFAVPTKVGAGVITVVSGGITKTFTLTGVMSTTPRANLVSLAAGTAAGSYTVTATDAFGNGVAADVAISVSGPGAFSNGFKNLTVTTAAANGQNTFSIISDGSAATVITASIAGAANYTAITAANVATYGLVAASAAATSTLAGKGGDSSSTSIAALTTLINSLIAKINALNKLVIKIQKKVRA